MKGTLAPSKRSFAVDRTPLSGSESSSAMRDVGSKGTSVALMVSRTLAERAGEGRGNFTFENVGGRESERRFRYCRSRVLSLQLRHADKKHVRIPSPAPWLTL